MALGSAMLSHNRHSREGGNPSCIAGACDNLDSRLRGNDENLAFLVAQTLNRVKCHPDPDFHTKIFTHRAKNGRHIIHAGVAVFRQPAVQALAGFGGGGGQHLETNGRIDQVTQNQPRSFWFTIEK